MYFTQACKTLINRDVDIHRTEIKDKAVVGIALKIYRT